jgi:trimeric autotransporter adhesin
MRALLLTLTIGCTTIELGEGEELGVHEAALGACTTGQWCMERAAALEAPLLHGVFALNENDVFAVGDQGTILRRTNGAWAAMSSGTTNDLRGVWAASSSDAWAVGLDGTILRFNGTSWSTVAAPDALDIDAIWGSKSNDVWFAGSSRVLRWDGASFRTFNLSGTLTTIHGTGPSDVWTTGENSFLWRFNGSSFNIAGSSSQFGGVFEILALSLTDVWITTPTPTKETLRQSGTKWFPKPTNSAFFFGLSALSSTSIWGAGATHVGRWNGLAWMTEQPFGSGAMLMAVSAVPGHVWTVGEGSLIGHLGF